MDREVVGQVSFAAGIDQERCLATLNGNDEIPPVEQAQPAPSWYLVPRVLNTANRDSVLGRLVAYVRDRYVDPSAAYGVNLSKTPGIYQHRPCEAAPSMYFA